MPRFGVRSHKSGNRGRHAATDKHGSLNYQGRKLPAGGRRRVNEGGQSTYDSGRWHSGASNDSFGSWLKRTLRVGA